MELGSLPDWFFAVAIAVVICFILVAEWLTRRG